LLAWTPHGSSANLISDSGASATGGPADTPTELPPAVPTCQPADLRDASNTLTDSLPCPRRIASSISKAKFSSSSSSTCCRLTIKTGAEIVTSSRVNRTEIVRQRPACRSWSRTWSLPSITSSPAANPACRTRCISVDMSCEVGTLPDSILEAQNPPGVGVLSPR
jgi:hypothetical protein